MNELQIFNSPEFGQVRTIVKNDEIWFVGKDVAEALGYSDTNQAIRKHIDEEDKLTRQIDGIGQKREMYIINESGLYSLVLSSTLPTDLYKRDDLINFYRYFNQELKDKAKKLDKLLELLYKSSFPVSVIDVLENIALDLSNISILANNLSLDTCNTDDLSASYCYIGQEVEKKADIISSLELYKK